MPEITNPFYTVTDENPNERFGVRACSFAGHQKHADCAGPWREFHGVRVAHIASKLTVCEFHGTEAFKTPRVKEVKPPRQQRRRVPANPAEELIL